jgi:uncharacterized protein YqjF (DUF2071 family)
MHHYWRDVSFLHWPYRPDIVRAFLPPGLAVDTFDGHAWVSLVPFLMDQVRPPGLPAVPVLSRFPETNVRTYVTGPDGNSGIWFFSLDAGHLGPVLAGRLGYGLPYMWSQMAMTRQGNRLRYASRRRWPGPRGAFCRAEVECGDDPVHPSDLDDFLTARFWLYTVVAGRLACAAAAHGPWPLRRAALTRVEQSLVQAAGLPAPQGAPIVHASPGVAVRIGTWRWVGRRAGHTD